MGDLPAFFHSRQNIIVRIDVVGITENEGDVQVSSAIFLVQREPSLQLNPQDVGTVNVHGKEICPMPIVVQTKAVVSVIS